MVTNPVVDGSLATPLFPPADTDTIPPVTTEVEPTDTLPSDRGSVLVYTVGEGDSIQSIAAALGVSVTRLLASNQLRSASGIRLGQALRISEDGILHIIKEGQTLTDISTTYGIPVDDIAEANGIVDRARIFSGERIVIPGATTSLWEAVMQLSRGRETRFIWPLEGEIVSEFGWRIHPVLETWHHHDGIDVDVPIGTLVRAAAAGRVTFVGDQDGYGTLVTVRHSGGYYTAYGHLSEILVVQGQFVEIGQPIARSGNSGISSGPHLHFEAQNGSFSIDPLPHLP